MTGVRLDERHLPALQGRPNRAAHQGGRWRRGRSGSAPGNEPDAEDVPDLRRRGEGDSDRSRDRGAREMRAVLLLFGLLLAGCSQVSMFTVGDLQTAMAIASSPALPATDRQCLALWGALAAPVTA